MKVKILAAAIFLGIFGLLGLSDPLTNHRVSAESSTAPNVVTLNKAFVGLSINSITAVSTIADSIIQSGISWPKLPSVGAITPDGTRLYWAGWGSSDGSIYAMDTMNYTRVATVTVSGNDQRGIAISPDGSRLYVADNAYSKVTVVNVQASSVITTVNLTSHPESIGLSPDGTKLYVAANSPNDNFVIDTTTNTVVNSFQAGNNPHGVAVSPDGQRVYISNWNSADVYVIATSNLSLLKTLPVGSGAGSLVLTPDGNKLYSMNYMGNSVSVMDTVALTTTKTITLPYSPLTGAITDDGTKLYVPLAIGSGGVAVINTSSDSVTSNIPTGTSVAVVTRYSIGGTTTYSVSGQVSGDSSCVSGVSMSDGMGHTATTDSNGNYTLSGLPSGSYTLAASKTGCTFSASFSQPVTVPPDGTGKNFTGTQLTYSINGQVTDGNGGPISGVLVSDNVGHSITTASNGNYLLSPLLAGSYTVTGSKSGYTFSPTSLNVTVPPNATGQNFTAALLTYSISGQVVGSNSCISGVSVSDGAGHTSPPTDSSGNYTLSVLPAGSYTLTASKSGCNFSASFTQPVAVPPNATGRNFVGTQVSQHIPVIIVPGFFATNCLNAGRYCGWIDGTNGKAASEYEPLITAFQSAGYVLNQDLFVGFYDWTQLNETSANQLAAIVNQAASHSPTGLVHIVTHSNGANVARSYIQNTSPSKVDTLVLIAPPNQGVVSLYGPWEGGDLSRQQQLVQQVLGVFYTPFQIVLTLDDPYRIFRGGQLQLFNAIHQFIPSAQELLPVGTYGNTFLYLTNSDGSLTPVDPSTLTFANIFLELLNSNSSVQKLYDNVSKVVIMAGQGRPTDASIIARPHQLADGSLWADGAPQTYNQTTADGLLGDGTIVNWRANLPNCVQPKCFFNNGYHEIHANPGGMDIVREVTPDVLTAMNIPVSAATQRAVRSISQSRADELLYAISGANIRFLIQDSNGHQIGYLPDGSFVSTIPGATYIQVTDTGGIVIVPNPISGQYTIRVSTTGSSNSTYGGAAYSYNSGLTQVEFTGTVDPGSPQVYTHNYVTSHLYLPIITR